MPYPYSMLVTAVTGNTLAATDYNNEHQNHINNNDPTSINDYSSNASAMQTTADPGTVGSESLATDLAGELARLRFAIKDIKNTAQWYTPSPKFTTMIGALLGYRRPVLQYSSSTVVNIETGINGTSGQAQILFPDGSFRQDSTAGRINCNLAQVAALSGSWQSGLRTGSVANNTWYAIYAVKTTDDTAKFVTVADTVFPIQANYATLNSNFGTSGWVYLGCVRNGDNGSSASGILSFVQNGCHTAFINVNTGGYTAYPGTILATSAVDVASLTWTYAAGSGAAQLPNTVGFIDVLAGNNTSSGFTLQNAGNTYKIAYIQGNASGNAIGYITGLPASAGLRINTGGTTHADIFLTGFWDGVLASGSSPIL